mgnify:CR=1 FL=1
MRSPLCGVQQAVEVTLKKNKKHASRADDGAAENAIRADDGLTALLKSCPLQKICKTQDQRSLDIARDYKSYTDIAAAVLTHDSSRNTYRR